jgi:hypothetical protein
MISRIRLFDRTGKWIYELAVPAFREWVLNDIGNGSFPVRAKGLARYIEVGNYVLIENDKLGEWVGLIENPLPWSQRRFTVNVKSAMQLFKLRVGSHEQPVAGSWGAVVNQMLGIMNNAEPTLLRIGHYDDGVYYASVVDMSNLYTYLQRALAQAGTRLDFRPVVTNGRLAIYLDIQPTLYTPTKLKLEEGKNLKNNTSILIKQGDICNDVTIMGVTLDQQKITARATHPESIQRYGLRQVLFSEGQSQADVDRLAEVRLAQYAFPRQTLGLTAIDKGDTLRHTRAGNAGNVELFTVGYQPDGSLGFRGPAYIRVVQLDDANKETVLVCEEIIQ